MNKIGYKIPTIWVDSPNLTASYYKEYLGFKIVIKNKITKENAVLLWKQNNLIWVKSKKSSSNGENSNQRIKIQTSKIDFEYSALINKVRFVNSVGSATGNPKAFTIKDCNGIEIVYTQKL